MHVSKTNLIRVFLSILSLTATAGAVRADDPLENPPKITATVYDSGFKHSHDTYNGMGAPSDGKIYYVLSTIPHDVAGQMFSFDPAAKKITHIADLTEISGEKDAKAVAQGKIHCNFVEANGKLYFATHTGFYAIIDDMEKMGPPPEGWKPYQGGHFLSYDMKTGQCENLALVADEGIITMNMDPKRGRLYGMTWPTSRFITYDLAKKEKKDLGPMARGGENGKGADYRTICRAFAIDPRDGAVYFSNGDGDILRYDYDRETIEKVKGDNLKKDYLGLYDPTSAGHMGYNWRQVFWHPTENVIYGVHGNSGYLFRFDPSRPRVEVLERLTSTPSKRCGMFDQFSYGYLGFTLGPDRRTIYYLTGGPIYENGRRVTGKDVTGKGEAKGLENLHLVTYDIPTAKYIDHGAIFMPDGQRPLYVNSIAVDKDGNVYTLGRVERNGRVQTDLLCISAKDIVLNKTQQSKATPRATSLSNPLAIRIFNYAKFENDAWTHAPSIGIHYLFIGVPKPDQVEAVEKQFAESRMKPLVMRGDSDLGRAACVEELSAQLATCQKMGVRYMFLSPKHTGVSKEVAYERLRRLGDVAKQHDVTIVLETHPDLGVNADAHLETMRQINHPNVRVNFDTGNITFYNQGTNAVAELGKIIDYVATVELKDHNGRCQDWNFPALGRGVVDFPAILKILEKHNFRGPITLEVEGVRGVTMTEEQTLKYIAESVRYIQSLGDFQ